MTMGQASALAAAQTGAPAAAAPALAGDRVRLLPFARLAPADLTAWRALGEQSGAPANVFARPWLVIAGLRHIAGPAATLALIEDARGALMGAIPLIRADRLGRMPLPHWQLWNHPNSFCAPVLIRSGQEARCWSALLAALAARTDYGRAAALAIAEQPLDSLPVTTQPLIVVERGWRAAIGEGEALGDYWDRHVRAKKRKELRRQAARLAELGTVAVDRLAAGADVSPWVDEFLALEQRGWKGTAQSALAADPGTAAYFREVVMEAQAHGQLLFLALRLDGRAIAMLVTLLDGDAAFSFKTAYDEAYARYSPGVLIQRDNLAALAGLGIRWADSCAAPDHPMIDSIWAQRRAIGTIVLALPGRRNRLIFNAYRAALSAWRQLKRLKGIPG